MRDCYYEQNTGISDFEERDSGNNHLNEPRTGMSVDENLWRNWSSQSWKAPGIQALQHLRGGRAAQWHGNENYIRSEVADLSKSSMAHRATWSKTAASIECLTTLKNLQQISALYRYDPLNLLSYMTLDVKNIHSVVHHKDKLFTGLDYPRNFGNVA